jgi:glycosyltransferase involved in cell wall biosynthesis
MRVLWFTNVPLEAINRRFGQSTTGGGFWMHALVEPLLASGEVKLCVVTATSRYPPCQFEEGGVTYVNLGGNKVLEAYDLLPRTRMRRSVAAAARVVHDFKPDLIHVHGSERFFGLVRARGLVNVPTVVSIQGLIEPYCPVELGVMRVGQILRHITWHDLMRKANPLLARRRLDKHIPIEREILRHVDGIIGRTAWDRAHTRAVNVEAPYFHVDEMMRPEFFQAPAWSLDEADPHLIVTTSGTPPRKGLPVLLEAVAILRRWGYPVRLKAAGVSADATKSGLVRFLMKRIEQLQIDDAVELLGWQPAEAMIEHQRKARCFVTPSLIENSCNALSEAQLLGLPCVASHAGGMTTLVDDDQTGLLFSPGDAGMLAHQIERVLGDDDLASRLGAAARARAVARHDPEQITQDLMNCYRSMAVE